MDRRAVLAGLSGLAALAGVPLRADGGGEASLIARARDLAARPWQRPEASLPPPFDALGYDSHRGIRPRAGGAGRIGLGGEMEAALLPPGWLFSTPVEVVLPGAARPVPFSPDLFDFDPRYFEGPPPAGEIAGAGFSGLRITAPLNRRGAMDEVLVFQGASYFRALGRGSVYGLSARALAMGTGGAAPEEFPEIVRIELDGVDGAGRLHLGALVDSPSAAAAFLVQMSPGDVTSMECALHLFPRVRLHEAGIAPLTSMFFFGPLGPAFADDFRPAVHDSDVLWMRNGAGEVLWRALANPAGLQMAAFADNAPRAFGLLQTPRTFDAYRDAEAAYHRRPHAWVEPLGNWGTGAVHLLEIPTNDEYADNIVAFWRPEQPLEAGEAYRFDYRLNWSATAPPAGAPLVPLRSASGLEPVERRGRLFVLDFARADGGGAVDVPGARLEVSVPGGGGSVTGEAVYAVPEAGVLRASFVFEPGPGVEVAELRAILRDVDGAPLSPVWLWRWTPPRGGGV
ncbi:MAG: glucan biosynthesis protein [Rhodobacteraceae bacterium]|nr:glucan biosynthesis protein [Paracoccaceae bacterium]